MCQCKDIEYGDYENMDLLDIPKAKGGIVQVDRCLSEEVKGLWDKGIRTVASCCGHNKSMPRILVHPEDIDKMIEMGYDIALNVAGIDNVLRTDAFYSKSVRYTQEQYINSIKHLLWSLN